MVVVARHHLHHTHYPRIQLAQDLRLSSPSSYLTPRSTYWPSSVQRWHVSSLPAHPQPTSNSIQHYIEPYPVPQVMSCVCACVGVCGSHDSIEEGFNVDERCALKGILTSTKLVETDFYTHCTGVSKRLPVI